MFLRSFYKSVIAYFCFASLVLILYPSPVRAVACGGDCSVYACDAGLSCSGGVCVRAAPIVMATFPETATTNNTSGTFYAYADGVANTDSILFPTWSSINGQDDIIWYPGVDLGGGTWRAAINLGTHSAGAGDINVHVYLNNCTYSYVWGGTANFTICPSFVACPVATCGTPPSNELNGTCGTHYCPGNPDTSPPAVPAPVVTANSCSGTVSVAWPAVSDVGCYGNVQYWLQTRDSAGVYYQNGWLSSPQTITNAPVVGRSYQANTLSSDNGASHTNQSAWSNTSAWTVGTRYCCPITPSNLSPSGTCTGPSTFPQTYTWSADPNASGYVLNITGCLVNKATATNSYTLSAGELTTCKNSFPTGSVAWTVVSTYPGGCANSSAAAASFNYDMTPPSIPGGRTVSFIPDPTCKEKYFAKYSWDAVGAGGGCAGLNASPYWSQGSSAVGFGSMLFGWTNSWVNALNQTSVQAYPPGTNLYFHVQSRDSVDNPSGFSSTDSVIVPTPSPYPTIHIEGNLVEDVNGVCDDMSLMSGFTLVPVINPAAGVTPICTMPTTSSYSCNFIINNQTGSCVSPNINVTMTGTYAGYGSIGWRTGAGGGQCNGLPTGIDLGVGNNETAPLYFSYNSVLPTAVPTPTPGGPTLTPTPIGLPTPTPLVAAGWFKVKDTSFNSRESRQNYIPYTVKKYNSTDIDDTDLTHNTLSGNSGALYQTGSLEAGGNAYVNNVKSYSTKNWYTEAAVYTPTNDLSYLKYVAYLKSRKDFTLITAISDIDVESLDGIYSVPGDVILNAAQFDGKRIVLIVAGKATFSADFIPVNGSVVVLANTIEIASNVAEIDAILIGGTVTTGVSEIGLKIKGNLIDESGILLDRSQLDGRMPSLFVVFDPLLYVNVMPYLSTSTYEWRQIQ